MNKRKMENKNKEIEDLKNKFFQEFKKLNWQEQDEIKHELDKISINKLFEL